jgi:hypothetical protein
MTTIENGSMKKGNGRSFFSIEYHARLFPALLWSRLRHTERAGTTFVPLESYLLIAFCLVLTAVGLPHAINHHSIIAWLAVGIGTTGILVLVIASICLRNGSPSCDDFLVGIFFFLVVLGVTAGIFAGTLEHSFSLGLLGSAAGLVLGYVLGIIAGLWFQYLGLLAVVLNMLAFPAIIGLIVVDLVLLLG